MKPGPAPKPTHLKVFHGETRPSRLNRREPVPRGDPPSPPTWLSREAGAEWRRLERALAKGLLTSADRQVMSVASEAWARWTVATRQVSSQGVTVVSERGVVKHPAIQVARDAEQTLRQCWAELGLSPAARARLQMPDTDPDSDLEGLFS